MMNLVSNPPNSDLWDPKYVQDFNLAMLPKLSWHKSCFNWKCVPLPHFRLLKSQAKIPTTYFRLHGMCNSKNSARSYVMQVYW